MIYIYARKPAIKRRASFLSDEDIQAMEHGRIIALRERSQK